MQSFFSKLSFFFYTPLFLLLGFILFPFPSHAIGIFENNFDTYSVGSVCTQAPNATAVNTCPIVTVATNVTSPNSIAFHAIADTNYGVIFSGNSTSTGSQSFWFYPSTLQSDLTPSQRLVNFNFRDSGNVEFSVGMFGNNVPFTDVYLRPTSTHYFSITPSQWHNLKFEWTNTQYKITLDFASSTPFLNRTSNGNINELQIVSSGSPDQGLIYFDSFATSSQNFLATLAITHPPDGDFINSGNGTISGTCVNVGTNQLYLFRRFRTDVLPAYFNIDCNSDYTWSSTYNYDIGTNEIYVYDRDFMSLPIKNENTTTTARISYTGFNSSSTSYLLGLIYPPDNGSTVHEVQYSNNFPLQFAYTLPNSEISTSTRFELLQFSDSTYITQTASFANNSLSFFDIDYTGRFTIQNNIIATTSPTYLEANLWNDNIDTLAYRIRFSLIGTSDSTAPAPVSPDIKDCGLICNSLRWAFVPSRRFISEYTTTFPDMLKGAIPFSYFYQIKDIFDAQSASSSDYTFSLEYSFGSSSTIPIFDPSNSIVQEFANGVRPFFIAGLWILFCIYLIHRVMDYKL